MNETHSSTTLSRSLNSSIALAAPILTLIYFVGHLVVLLGPFVLVHSLVRAGNWWTTFFVLFVSWSLLIPLTLMLYWALVVRLLPKPNLGPILDARDALKNALLAGVYNFARTSGSRAAMNLVPLPAWLFYRLAGARIAWSALISSPDCIPDPHLVEIGEGSIIGQGAVLTGHFQPSSTITRLGKIVIGRNVLIGVNCTVFPNTSVGENSILQVGSVLKPGTTVPPNEIWGGSPAKRIRNV